MAISSAVTERLVAAAQPSANLAVFRETETALADAQLGTTGVVDLAGQWYDLQDVVRARVRGRAEHIKATMREYDAHHMIGGVQSVTAVARAEFQRQVERKFDDESSRLAKVARVGLRVYQKECEQRVVAQSRVNDQRPPNDHAARTRDLLEVGHLQKRLQGQPLKAVRAFYNSTTDQHQAAVVRFLEDDAEAGFKQLQPTKQELAEVQQFRQDIDARRLRRVDPALIDMATKINNVLDGTDWIARAELNQMADTNATFAG